MSSGAVRPAVVREAAVRLREQAEEGSPQYGAPAIRLALNVLLVGLIGYHPVTTTARPTPPAGELRSESSQCFTVRSIKSTISRDTLVSGVPTESSCDE